MADMSTDPAFAICIGPGATTPGWFERRMLARDRRA